MKNKLAKPDIALMSFAISVSKKAAVVATIKYGRVMVSNGEKKELAYGRTLFCECP